MGNNNKKNTSNDNNEFNSDEEDELIKSKRQKINLALNQSKKNNKIQKEKEIMKKRKMKIDEQIKKIKEQFKSLEIKPVENYLFYKMANNFEEKEKLFYKKIKLTEKVVGREELKMLKKKLKNI